MAKEKAALEAKQKAQREADLKAMRAGDAQRDKVLAAQTFNAGFADQAHFQRTFKRVVAATPNQYRQPSVQQQEHAASDK